MVVAALLAFALLAWFQPRLALGVLLFLIPFGHLVRFAVAGVPFTFPEAAVYALAGALAIHHFFSSFRASSEKSHTGVPPSHDVRSLGSGLGMTRWLAHPWTILPLLWILVAAIAAFGSPAGMRAWGIWKAYFLGPVLLFWTIRRLFLRPTHGAYTHPSSFRASREPKPRAGAWREKSHTGVPPGYDVRSLSATGRIGMTSGVVLPLALGAFIVAAIAIAQRWWPIGVPYPWSLPGQFRATSVFGYPNAVGLYLAPLVPLLVGSAFSFFSSSRAERSVVERSHVVAGASNGVRFLAALGMTIVAIAALVAIAFARSTGALVALVVTLLAWLFFARHAHRRKNAGHTDSHDRENRCAARGGAASAAILIVWIAASLAATAWLPYRGEHRWGSPLVQKLTFQKWSGSVRLSQYRETWKLLRDHPIRGAGLAGYQTAIAPYHEKKNVEIFLYPHNLLLAVWVELGLAGVLVFLAILYRFLRSCFRASGLQGFRAGAVAAMLVILAHGFVDVPYFKNDLAMVFWVLVALAAMSVENERAPGNHERSAVLAHHASEETLTG